MNSQESAISQTIFLGKYYAWRGGSGRRDDYSYRVVRFKKRYQTDREYFVGRVATAIMKHDELNRPSVVLVPVPASKAHDPRGPHRGELLCQAVAAVPGVTLSYGNYLVRTKGIPSSHGRSVASRPSVQDHMNTMDVRIPHKSGRYVTKLGTDKWRKLHVVLFDDVYYFGATSEACAMKLRNAGFSKIYAIFLGQNQP